MDVIRMVKDGGNGPEKEPADVAIYSARSRRAAEEFERIEREARSRQVSTPAQPSPTPPVAAPAAEKPAEGAK